MQFKGIVICILNWK